ncbi:unnamed protein product [Adineta ricciae]|uniref:G-protein coupled receptors family 1 profile domain-containing protein n=1 Tax=Adineta ricciae TaxID=249248 RepID=A0A815Y3C7_ADIRI|nr:unnamed protein product [Adineta ricciae]CAF1565430.1 unnamed protein product [Adineta ricciae]
MNINTPVIYMAQIIPPIQFVFGTMGNIINIILFIRPNLRTNPCSIYCLAGSINNILFTCLFALTDYLSNAWNINLSLNTDLWCKLSVIIKYLPYSLLLWFPVLASIDRFLSSSRNVQLRQLSNVKIARRMIIGIYIILIMLNIHLPIFARSSPSDVGYYCTIFSDEYYIFNSFFTSILYCVLPLILMCIFGILIIHNVHNIHNRVVPNLNNVQNTRLRSQDRQMIRMLLFQILITILLSLPYMASFIYIIVRLFYTDYNFSWSEYLIYYCFIGVSKYLYHTNFAIGFYIYTLASVKYRAELKHCLHFGFNTVVAKLK